MISYDEAFQTHAVHDTLRDLEIKLHEADFDDLEVDERLMITQIRQVIEVTITLLDSTDSALTSVGTLNSINSHSSQILGEITNFVTNGDSVHIQNTKSYIDALLNQIPLLFSLKNKFDLRGFHKSMTSFRNSLTDEINRFSELAEHKRAELIEKNGDTEKEFVQLTSQFVELQSEVSIQKRRLDDAISEFQTQFSTSQEQRRKEFEKLKSTGDKQVVANKERFGASLKAGIEKVKNVENDFKVRGDEFELQLKEYQSEIEELLEITSELVLTTDYSKKAAKEAERAKWWLIATGVGFALLITFAVLIFLSVIFNWNPSDSIRDPSAPYLKLLSKLFVTAVLGLAVRWTSKQANRHQEEEKRFRRTALELATISPYLRKLDPKKQEEIKTKLSEKLFGQIQDSPHLKTELTRTDDSHTYFEGMVGMIKDLAEIFQKK